MIFPDRVFGRMSSITYCRNGLLSVTGRCIGRKAETHNLLRGSKRSNSLSNLNRQFLFESTRCSWLKVRLGGNERVHGLTSQLIGSANDSGFRNTVVNDQGAFDLSGTDSVTGHVDDVVYSTLDPVVTLVVSSDSITVVEVSRVRLEVGFDVTSVITVDGSCQGWPRLLADNDTFNIVSFQKLASRRVQETDIVTQEGERCRSRLGCSRTGDRSNADRTGLGHPVRVNDGTLSASDIVVVPVPRFRVDRFTDTADNSQTRKVLVLDIRIAKSSKQSNSLLKRRDDQNDSFSQKCSVKTYSRSCVELSDLVLVDKVPISRCIRVDRSRFEKGGSRTQSERAIDDVAIDETSEHCDFTVLSSTLTYDQ